MVAVKWKDWSDGVLEIRCDPENIGVLEYWSDGSKKCLFILFIFSTFQHASPEWLFLYPILEPELQDTGVVVAFQGIIRIGKEIVVYDNGFDQLIDGGSNGGEHIVHA